MSSGVQDGDFLAVELAAGHVRYVFNTGSGARAVLSSSDKPVNDNQWHNISIDRCLLCFHLNFDEKLIFLLYFMF